MGRSHRRRRRSGGSGGSSSSLRKSQSDAGVLYGATPNRHSKGHSESHDIDDDERSYDMCEGRYRNYIVCISGWGEGHERCEIRKNYLEETCGHYKSLWSSWWTEKDEKGACELWESVSKRCISEKCDIESLFKECAQRACKPRLPESPPPQPSFGSFLRELIKSIAVSSK